MQAFSALKTSAFAIDTNELRSLIGKEGKVGRDSLTPDSRTALYYKDGGQFLWVTRQGVTPMADTLVSLLHRIGDIGLSEKSFKVEAIEENLQRFNSLDFDEKHPATAIAAQLEYQLTNSYLRYVAGQRYGFVNPKTAMNYVESKPDSLGNVKRKFVNLFDTPVLRPDEAFYQTAFRKIQRDSVGGMMREVEPQSDLYKNLRKMLPTATDDAARKRVLVNMERCRWQEKTPMPSKGRRVVVNIPAFMLYAFGPDSTMEMRIGCGKTTTRTPLLTSAIEYMQVNPEWSIPMSIIRNDVAAHAGDSSYFARHRYYISDGTGKKISPRSVSSAMLTSGKYRVAQDGGRGNSLGRIVFRFKNNFSVYLHDTSTPGFFQNAWRGVSHGCVRVQRPFDLARFLLGNTADDWTLDKIRISMDIPPVTEQGKDYIRSHSQAEGENGRKLPHRLVSTLQVTPHVPLYIIYYTLYPDRNGVILTHPDVYGYDEAVWRHLKNYI